MKITVIGQSSYLSQDIEAALPEHDILRLSHKNWVSHADDIRQSNLVINFCIQPESVYALLPAEDLMDVQIADIIGKSQAKMIFLSSRTVYGISDECRMLSEKDPVRPLTPYAQNKVQVEQLLAEKLGSRFASFRIANILGPPPLPGSYLTFIAWVSREIHAGKHIQLTVDRRTRKDFITRSFLHKNIASFAEEWQDGLWNVGSGIATSLGELLDILAGPNNFEDKEGCIKDQFILDPTKLRAKNNLSLTKDDLFTQCQTTRCLLIQNSRPPSQRSA